MFATLGFGSQIPLLRANIPWFRVPNLKGTNRRGTKENSLTRVEAAFVGGGGLGLELRVQGFGGEGRASCL